MAEVVAFNPGRKSKKAAAIPKQRAKSAEKTGTKQKTPEQRKRETQTGAAAILGAVALGAIMWIGDKGEIEDSCTSVTQDLVQVGAVGTPGKALETKNRIRSALDTLTFGRLFNDQRSISGVARELSQERGYTIPVERLVAANSGAPWVKFEDGELKDSMNVADTDSGVYCVNVPSPVYSGYELVHGTETTLQQIAASNSVPMEQIRALNPHLADAKQDQPLDEGAVVRVAEQINTAMVLREMTEEEGNLNNIANGDIQVRNALLIANGAVLGDGGAAGPGSDAFLPYAETEFTKEHALTHETVVAAFAPDSVALDVSFIEEKKEESKVTDEVIEAAPVPQLPENVMQAATQRMIDGGPEWRHRGIAMRFFMEKGLSAEQAAGIVGNLVVESASSTLDPKAQQGRGDDGQGIAQWSRNGRWVNLQAFVANNRDNKDPYDLMNQLEFIWYEMNNDAPWSKTLPALKEVTTADEATRVFMELYEKPGVPHLDRRIAAASEVLTNYVTHAQAVTAEQEAVRAAAELEAWRANAPTMEQLKEKYGDVSGKLADSELDPLGKQWEGHRLHPRAAQAFRQLNEAYKAQFGQDIIMTDSYRSYDTQVSVKENKPHLAATPGKSNHGWGFAMDLSGGIENFGTPQHDWMRANAPQYGIHLPSWAQQGGSKPEPWHWEFVE